MIELLHGDCIELMKNIPNGSIDLVLTDPPYNIGCKTEKDGKKIANRWDKNENYLEWCILWILECQRVLKPTGVLYFFHNNMKTIAKLLSAIEERTNLAFISFCIWNKGDAYRAQSWHNRDKNGKAPLRSWFNVCEYCLHFFNAPPDANNQHTSLERINSNPECYKPLKERYAAEKERLGITEKDIARKYTEVTGRKPYMLKHYFRDSQFEIPKKEIFESVYEALGFVFSKYGLHGYEAMRQEYEAMRQEYEALRNVHIVDDMHCNVWNVPPIPSQNRYHTCQKPLEILERLCRVSSREGAVVLDPFMGSGSTGVAALNTGRSFIGIEQDAGYFEIAKNRINHAKEGKYGD